MFCLQGISGKIASVEVAAAVFGVAGADDFHVLEREVVVVRDLLACWDVARGEEHDALRTLERDTFLL